MHKNPTLQYSVLFVTGSVFTQRFSLFPGQCSAAIFELRNINGQTQIHLAYFGVSNGSQFLQNDGFFSGMFFKRSKKKSKKETGNYFGKVENNYSTASSDEY